MNISNLPERTPYPVPVQPIVVNRTALQAQTVNGVQVQPATLPVLKAAQSYAAAGLSVIPVKEDKRPIGPWKDKQQRISTPEAMHADPAWQNALNLGIVCGGVSGNGESIDVDNQAIGGLFYNRILNERPDLAVQLVIQNTPSGGFHLIYRVAGGPVPGNQKLAAAVRQVTGPGQYTLNPDGTVIQGTGSHSQEAKQDQNGNWFCLFVCLETRGEGGYIVAFPSPGYNMCQGDLRNIPTISKTDRDWLIQAARSFDESGQINCSAVTPKPEYKPDPFDNRPLTQFNRSAGTAETVLALKVQADWQLHHFDNEYYYITRPGKSLQDGHSATIRRDNGLFHNFSSSVPGFEPGRSFQPSEVFTRYRHNGDHSAAAKALLNSFKIAPDAFSSAQITYLTFRRIYDTPVKIEWLIEDLAAAFDAILIHGPGGIGKSLLIQFIAFKGGAVAFEKLFDRFLISTPICTLFLQSENGQVAFYQRTQKMIQGHPELEPALDRVFTLSQYEDTTVTGQNFLSEAFCDFIVEKIAEIERNEGVKINLFVVDPLVSFSGVSDENDTAKMRPALDAISSVCRRAKCTPLVVHHDRKDGEDYRGASGINDWTRNRIGLKHRRTTETSYVTTEGSKMEKITQDVDCIKVTHEKCNNFKKFSSFYIKLCENLHFERIIAKISPEDAQNGEKVVQALHDLGGRVEGQKSLAKTYGDLTGVSPATAKRHISRAVDNRYLQMHSMRISGRQTYVYELPN